MKRQRRGLLPSFDSPRRCDDLRDSHQRRTFPQVRQSPHLFFLRGTGERRRYHLYAKTDESRILGLPSQFSVEGGTSRAPSPTCATRWVALSGAAAADPPCRKCRLRPSPKGLGRAKRRGCGDCVLPSSAPGSGRPQSPARKVVQWLTASKSVQQRGDS